MLTEMISHLSCSILKKKKKINWKNNFEFLNTNLIHTKVMKTFALTWTSITQNVD